MTNPYHDENGRFCSKNEMKAIVDQLGKAVADQRAGRGKALSNGEHDQKTFDRWMEMKTAYEAAANPGDEDRLPTEAELRAVRRRVAARRATRHEALSALMEFGATIRSDSAGKAHNVSDTLPMEEIQYADMDLDGSVAEPVAPAGWEYLTGFSGQHGYDGAIMHESEVLNGSVAQHILENPGSYAAVEIYGMPQDVEDTWVEPAGWGVLRKLED